MNILLTTFQAVFALLCIGVLGFWVIGHRQEPASTLGFLSALAIDIALPFLVLANLIRNFSPENFPDWWHMPLWWLGFTLISLALTLTTSLIAKKEIRSEFSIGLFYQNSLFYPLVIINGLFGIGNPYLVSLFVFMIIQPSMVFITYPLFFDKQNVPTQTIKWQRIFNPVMVTTVIGIIVCLVAAKEYVPGFILSMLTMVGAMATPIFMLILGGNIYHDFMYGVKGERKFEIWEVMKFVIIKNLIFPLCFIGLLIWIRPDTTTALIVVLQAAVPPITSIPIFAERCGGNRGIASQFIVGSFIFSVISIPAIIYLFSRFFSIPFK